MDVSRITIQVEDDIYLEVRQWCFENIRGKYKWFHNPKGYFDNMHSISFYEEYDAMAFKLRWS